MSGVWKPFSNSAYGANALYVPRWGESESYEFIFALTQNFPLFKSHPVLDVWHMYHTGSERYDQSLEYRVTSWGTDLPKGAWSFLYLPERSNDLRGYFRFYTDNGPRLRLRMEFVNPDECEREWQLQIYFCRSETARLEGYEEVRQSPEELCFRADGRDFRLHLHGMAFSDAVMGDSNAWMNFPFNVENSYFPVVRNDRFRDRLKLTAEPFLIPGRTVFQAELEIIPGGAEHLPVPGVIPLPAPSEEELPFWHEMWEAWHNQEYAESFHGTGAVSRPIPARQWGNFWFWDTGFTAFAAVDFDSVWAKEILRELPEPEDCPRCSGSYIPTGIDALWHLFESTGDRQFLAELYPRMKRMISYWQAQSSVQSEPGMYNKNRGAGSDDNPCSCYCSNFVFSWGYHRTLPRNARHRNLECIDIEVTSHMIHYLRMMRQIAEILGAGEDVEEFSTQIRQSEAALETHWSEKRGCYLYRAGGEDHLLDIEWIGCYNPLTAGVPMSGSRQKRMLKALWDERRYWTEYGLAAVALDNPNFREGGYPNGCVWAPNQFFYWLGLYDRGEIEMAVALIDRYLAMFVDNHRRDLMCWEQFRAATGRGTGNARFSSFVTPIVSMWKSRTELFYVTTGFGTEILNRDFSDRAHLKVTLCRPFDAGLTGASLVLPGSGRGRILCNGTDIGAYQTDKKGFVIWKFYAQAGKKYQFEFVPEDSERQ